MTKRAFLIAIGLVAIALVITLPEPSSVANLPASPKLKASVSSTTQPAFEDLDLRKVSGTTAIPGAEIRGGNATIRGKVSVGGALVEGATVRIDRFVGDKTATLDVTSNAEGHYSFSGIEGGRYRVRAFRRPDATMGKPEVIFLSKGESRSLDLNMTRYGSGINVGYSVAPDPPRIGQSANVAVSVLGTGVDANGVARSLGQNGISLTLQAASGRTIMSANPVVTSGNGVATWTLRCNSLTDQGLSVVLPDGSIYNVNVASCQPPPTTTTTLLDTTNGTTTTPRPTSSAGNGAGNGRGNN